MKKKEQSIFVTRTSMPPYEEYVEMIKPLWDTHWLTNMGQYHQKLENELREYLQVEQLSLLVNGHMSLEMAIQAMEFPEGSEVITTPFTFVSTTHAIVRNRLKPVFCDIKPDDFTIDETKIENLITEKTVAIVPVHVYGNICNVEAIEQIAKNMDYELFMMLPMLLERLTRNMELGVSGMLRFLAFMQQKSTIQLRGEPLHRKVESCMRNYII